MDNTETTSWRPKDTAACERGRSSGLALNLKTDRLFTVEDMIKLGEDYDKVRNDILVDEFLKDKLKAVPFSFAKQSLG